MIKYYPEEVNMSTFVKGFPDVGFEDLEEEQRLQLQREAEERERQRLEQELLRRQEESRESSPLSPFEEFFGLRPPRMTQSKSQQSVRLFQPQT